jgi:DNA-binding LacI/PurR family transcriptional regulator
MPNKTMQEIAKELGISRRVVSMVVNGNAEKHRISRDTIEKVKKYLKKRGFVPSKQATDLQSKNDKNSDSVGILYCDDLNPHQLEAYNRIVTHYNHTPRRLEIMAARRPELTRSLEEMVARGVNNLIWIHSRSPRVELENDMDLLLLLRNMKRAVMYNYHFGENGWDEILSGKKIHLIGVDRGEGTARIVRFLDGLGHRSVYVYAIREWQSETIRRAWSVFEKPGYQLVYSAAGLDTERPSSLEMTADSAREFGQTVADDLIRHMQAHKITAACFMDDEMAGHAMAELVKRGVRIPEDLTVTGFNGIRAGAAFVRPLTTLRVPVEKMVDAAVELLKEKTDNYRHCFELELLERGSHGAHG